MKLALMRGLGLASAILSSFAEPSAARADFYDGNKLLQDCTVEKIAGDYFQRIAFCTNYIGGAVDMMTTWQIVNKAEDCIPSNATLGQIRDVTVKWLQNHPERRADAGSLIVLSAMMEGFKCKLGPQAK